MSCSAAPGYSGRSWPSSGPRALGAVRSTWRDVTLTGCRFGAFDATSSTLTDVTIHGGKFDFVNLRGATLTRVVFEDCLLGELHLAETGLQSVRFSDCRIESLELRNAKATDVDLRGADLRGVDGVEHLRGARISDAQLQRLAPALAEHVGILVGDPPAAPRGSSAGMTNYRSNVRQARMAAYGRNRPPRPTWARR